MNIKRTILKPLALILGIMLLTTTALADIPSALPLEYACYESYNQSSCEGRNLVDSGFIKTYLFDVEPNWTPETTRTFSSKTYELVGIELQSYDNGISSYVKSFIPGNTMTPDRLTSFTNRATAIYIPAAGPVEYALTTSAAPAEGGSTSPQQGRFPENTPIPVSAAPSPGYHFTGWQSSGGGVFGNSAQPSTTFTMPAGDADLTANFAPNDPVTPYTLNVVAGTGGQITQNPSGQYAGGEQVTIAASADPGYRFSGWSSSGGAIGNAASASTTFTMPAANATVTASFLPQDGGGSDDDDRTPHYSIQATAREGGSISPSGRVLVGEKEDGKFRIRPEEGYRITDVLVDGKSVGPVESYTFEDVQESHEIEARFAPMAGAGAVQNPNTGRYEPGEEPASPGSCGGLFLAGGLAGLAACLLRRRAGR